MLDLEKYLRDKRNVETCTKVKLATLPDSDEHILCFYEGQDGVYYNSVLKSYKIKFRKFQLGGKQEVLKHFESYATGSDSYNNRKCIFFIDRDFDENLPNHEDLYITPRYSLENLYAQIDVFISFVEDIVPALNDTDLEYRNCVDIFQQRFEEYTNILSEFNAILWVIKTMRSESQPKWDEADRTTIAIRRGIDVTLDGVSKKEEYIEILNELQIRYDITKNEVKLANKQLQLRGKQEDIFRGKNQLDGFCEIIDQIFRHKDQIFIEEQEIISINFKMKPLFLYSKYVDVPECLKRFLEAHIS
ncbi:MAG: hypothetical protein ATN35_09305 [Epulopiscium sp. Nele67-Bin004]|nr:MAG: hypothetical protein ATN35_09305 [Epulopiscium sp. Nele67-Bin004]